MPRLNEPSWKEKLSLGGVSDNAAEIREGGNAHQPVLRAADVQTCALLKWGAELPPKF